jgi:hypothetical protein
MALVPHPLHSPDLVPCDFSPFPRLQIKLKRRHFDTTEVVEAESQVVLNTFAKHYFQDAFNKDKSTETLNMRGRGIFLV